MAVDDIGVSVAGSPDAKIRGRDIATSGVPKIVQVVEAGSVPRNYLGSQVLDLSDGAAHTLTVPANARFADLRFVGLNAGDQVNVLHSGTPTAATPWPIFHGESFTSAAPAALAAIRAVGTTAKLYIEYYDGKYT